jgi:multiple sugar transport system permease protein
VVLPLLKPALVTLGVFVFLYQWNEFIWTLTITRANPETAAPDGRHLPDAGRVRHDLRAVARQAALAVSVVPLALVF